MIILAMMNFFPLSIIGNDYHTQIIATDVIIDFEKYTNDSLQNIRMLDKGSFKILEYI